MTIYILQEDLPNTDAGTKLFFQDGMYFYKDNTENEHWLTKDYVENNSKLFKEWKKVTA